MKKMTAELVPMYAVPEADMKLFVKWMWEQRKETNFDLATLSYPRACMWTARAGEDVVLMLPLHPVLMFESIARKPELSGGQTGLALVRIGEEAEKVMELTGHGEAFFITNNAGEVEQCKARGWVAIMHDSERGEWLMKKRADVDWLRVAQDANKQ